MYPVSLGPLALSTVGNASASGACVYGAATNFGSGVTTNCLVGARALVIGFSLADGVNNSGVSDGLLVLANSGNTTITLLNPNGISETGNGTLYLFTEFLVNSTADVSGYPQPNFGPSGPFGTGGTSPTTAPGQGGPDWAPGTPKGGSLTAKNFFNSWNYVNSELAVQQFLTTLATARNVQQGVVSLTNVTAVAISGIPVGGTSFVQTSGPYRRQ